MGNKLPLRYDRLLHRDNGLGGGGGDIGGGGGGDGE